MLKKAIHFIGKQRITTKQLVSIITNYFKSISHSSNFVEIQ